MTTSPEIEDRLSSVSKALAILEVMARSDGRAFGVSDLALVTDIPKSTAHRLLKAMEERGFIGRSGSKYRVGARCLQLSSVARWSEYGMILEHAAPVMEWLFERTGETVHLAVLDGAEVLYLEKINGRGGCRMRTRVGARLRAETTPVGRVLCAFRTGAGADGPADGPADPVAPLRIRQAGFVACRDACQGLFAGVAAPVMVHGFPGAVAGLSVDGPVPRFRPELCAGLVREASARLSRRLGPYLIGGE
jgi:DNA-binding IclR family transcriptional regulator